MLKRRHINADPAARAARAARAVAEAARPPAERFAWTLETRVVWRATDLLRSALEALRWPFERLAWVTERKLLWPLAEGVAGRRPPHRTAAVGALGAIAVGVVVLVVLSSSGGEQEAPQAAAPVRAAVASAPKPSPAPAPTTPQPVLHGVPPSFKTVKRSQANPVTGGAEAEPRSGSETKPGEEAGETAGAVASSAKPVPAGPIAMRVARRFAEAFVFYEVGEHQVHAKAVFEETAAPTLAEALDERPPRLPANAKVPKAKVVNLVPGPRRGKAYTVSVSLLRVGLTSELRVTLEHSKAEGWRVTEILG